MLGQSSSLSLPGGVSQPLPPALMVVVGPR
nr:MAG TPA: hypothetical protein [Caudoviricetes sp.]